MAFEKAISLPFSIDTFGSVGTTTDNQKFGPTELGLF